MATTIPKPLTVSPLKLSPALGGALAFMGMDGCLPLFHGAQGCTAFALVALVRHYREAIPLQTTAMNEITTILGGSDNVEEALLTITRRARPKVIGLLSTALTETRGEDMESDLRSIRSRNPELAGVEVVFAATPDYAGSLEAGWSRAVSAMVAQLPQPGRPKLRQVNILPGVHQTAGDIEALRDMVEAFGLEAVVLPDLSGSLDGHVPETWHPTTLGGTTVEQARSLSASLLTIAIGEHMRAPAELLARRTGVPAVVLDRVVGLDAVDDLMATLSTVSGRPAPERYRRQRSQLVDAMLDAQFAFAGSRLAVAGESDLVRAVSQLVEDMGAELVAAISAGAGDLDDLETRVAEAGCDLVIANSNAAALCERLGVPLFRLGFPVYDRLGNAHLTTAGYRGTRDLLFALGNTLLAAHHQPTERPHGHSPAAAAHA